ncbi:MAG: cobalamin biosynthesis protein [Sphingomonas adhaesiva]|uniref:cobalamin biosynthesis protein n=1 Tax=Sphingomonas adhaesiva TaxID=28212 RepID=UPI002FF6BB45
MIVAGFGFRSGATAESLQAALILAQAGRPDVAALAAPADKIAPLGILGERLGLPVLPIAPAALRDATTATRSAASLAARDTGSVAEAAALAGAGAGTGGGARLIAYRRISPDRMATCAIAEGSTP